MMWLYCSLLLGNVRSMWVHVAAQAEKTTLQNNDFVWFLVSSQGTHLLSFFAFSICFKCWMTIEWLTLSSWATSHVVVRGSALMIASHYAPHPQSSCHLCTNFLNHHCTVYSLAVLRPNALLILEVVSTALWHILNSNKKIPQICFLLNIISIV